MDECEKQLLFESLSQILYNQDQIKKHLGINKHDPGWGWDDEKTVKLADECFEISIEYEEDEE